jgi:hypothetical protein
MPIVIDPPGSLPLPPPTDDGSNYWELLYEALGFHRDQDLDYGYGLRGFCEGLCLPMQPVHDLVRERDDMPGWGALFDPDVAEPDQLPYLAQYPGCVLTPDMSVEQIRNEIREPTGWARGRDPAIPIAAQGTLTGSRRVLIRPRTPELGIHYIRTLKSETPSENRTQAVLRAAVPAWEVLDYAAIDGVTWGDVAAGWDDWSAVADDFESWADLADLLPSELPEP